MNDQIREIEERCNAATKGEWEWDESDAEFRAYIEDDTGFVRMSPIVFAQSELLEGEPVPYIEITENDADFIAHARTDVQTLIAEVKRLTRELDAAVADVNRLTIFARRVDRDYAEPDKMYIHVSRMKQLRGSQEGE